jgi:hypothetical protein
MQHSKIAAPMSQRVIRNRAAGRALLSIQRQMPAGKNRRLAGQPQALQRAAKSCRRVDANGVSGRMTYASPLCTEN